MEHIRKHLAFYVALFIFILWAIRYFTKDKTSNVTSTVSDSTSDTSTPASVNTLTVSNVNGAVIFNQVTEGMKSTNNKVSYNTKLAYTNIVTAPDCSTQVCYLPSDFYNTASGFLSKKDITIIN